ncbi:DUF4145 domain-containing protein [Vibrio sp. 10N.286.49.C2]|uniref:DUF4145 domain-containing protein n=1 Tax=unclassified Vibrio TaxID=2614977 RepID=UPI000C81B202|nr:MULTISPECIES: DUF4145 domain-containing protein [unclassified Vibrio]PMH35576.1 DUF4145 domain-containing protein [Vibrio sp. 10N.286.49.C2]PMH49865.1 DUF4145 domain-containing protein [Vibrio sp. 10N.286.49.B1]
MSDIESVVLQTRRIEKLLRQQYRADGKGLHQLITSCEERLPHDVVGKLRYIATIRNKIVHEDDYQLDDKRSFMRTCAECEQELTPRSSRFVWRAAVWLMALITIMAMGFYYIHWEKVLHILSK